MQDFGETVTKFSGHQIWDAAICKMKSKIYYCTCPFHMSVSAVVDTLLGNLCSPAHLCYVFLAETASKRFHNVLATCNVNSAKSGFHKVGTTSNVNTAY